MNAESYLRKQGWKGSGHSLDTTGRGIKKPLLIAHKQDQLGLGKKKAAWTTDDQWWMRAFDESLQNIGTGQDSTLNQIRTKGINRGGLYGFFVKGEAIAGTIEDSSASATDASVPPSGASTPPTSASDSEAPAKMTERKTKRKRAVDESSKAVKKANSSNKESASVERKIAKLSIKKRAMYEARAATKKQSLDDYIARRIAKKAEKQSTKRATRCDKSTSPVLSFTDLEGDATLSQQVQTVRYVDDKPTDMPSTDPHDTAPSANAKTSTPGSNTQNVTGSEKGTSSADAKPKVPKWKEAMKQARKAENKAKKTEKKAQKAERRAKSTSKWGANKATNSRWGRIKAEKQAAKEAAVK